MTLIYGVLVDRVIRDGDSNTVSLISLIEDMAVWEPAEGFDPNPEEPINIGFDGVFTGLLWAHPDIEVPEEFPIKLEVLTPKGFKVFFEFTTSFKSSPKTRINIELKVLPYHGEGLYLLTLYVPGDSATWPLNIRVTPKMLDQSA